MRQVLFSSLILVGLIGCQNPWGSRTVPPPGTGTAVPPVTVGENYYPENTTPAAAPVSSNQKPYYTPAVPNVETSTEALQATTEPISGVEAIKRVAFQSKRSTTSSGEPAIKIVESTRTLQPQNAASLKEAESKITKLQSVQLASSSTNPVSNEVSILKNRNKESSILKSAVVQPSKKIATTAVTEKSVLIKSSSQPTIKLQSPSLVRSKSRYGYRTDHTELRGRLEYSQSRKTWKLRYIPIDGNTDQYGGSVQLSNTAVLDGKYRDGDFVVVTGNVDSARGNQEVFAPLYHAKTVQTTIR